MSFAQPAPSALVLADHWVGGRVRSATLVVLGAVLTGASALVSIPIPGTPVPMTLQTFAVVLIGTALGARLGAASMLLYVVAGLLGVPWFAGQTSGYHLATLGYLIGFVVAAAVCGALARRSVDRRHLGALLSMIAGNLAIYACGVPVLAYAISVDLGTAIDLGVRPFLIGDAFKILVAAGLLPSVWRLIGGRSSS